jgi:hypothetical protein
MLLPNIRIRDLKAYDNLVPVCFNPALQNDTQTSLEYE